MIDYGPGPKISHFSDEGITPKRLLPLRNYYLSLNTRKVTVTHTL